MSEAPQPNHMKFFGWINITLLFAIYGSIYGFIFYGFTFVFPEMIKAMSWARGDAAFAHTLRAFSLGAFAPLVAISVDKFGAKRNIIAGLVLGIAVMTTLGAVTSQLWHWIVLWGIIMPISFAFGGAIPIQTMVTFWFNIKRGTALGIVLTASAVAGFFVGPFYTFIMQQTGTWRTGWLTAGGFCAVALVLAFFIKNKPEDVGQFPDGIDPEKSSETTGPVKTAKTFRTSESWTFKEVLRTRVIYLIGICMIAQGSALYLLTTHGVLHLTDIGFTRMQAASILGNLVLFSGFARFPMGYLGDKIEPRWIITIAMAGMAITLLGIWKPPGNFVVLLLCSGIFGFSFGAMVPMFPALIGNYFGAKVFASLTGFLSPVMVVFSAPVPMVAGIIFDKLDSYDIAFIYVTILIGVAVLCGTFLAPPKKSKPA